jgi:RNA recognition motif-containing protein
MDTLKACWIVKSIKGKSRGFGRMEFFTEQQARASMPLFFHSISINGREIIFDLETPKPQLRTEEREKSAKGSDICLFLGNLAYDVDENMLRTHIVEYMRAAHASASAVSVAKAAARKLLKNSKSPDTESNTNSTAAATSAKTSMSTMTTAIANSDSDRSTELPSEFKEPVINIKLNRGETESKGYALAYFADLQSMSFALDAIKYTELNGRAINVKIYKLNAPQNSGVIGGDGQQGSERAPATTASLLDIYRGQAIDNARNAERFAKNNNSLYIGNLHFKATHKEIFDQIVGALGPNRVKSLRLSVNKYNKERNNGFGFVLFYDSVEASTALEELTGLRIRGRSIRAGPGGDVSTGNGNGDGEGDESDQRQRHRSGAGLEHLPRLED